MSIDFGIGEGTIFIIKLASELSRQGIPCHVFGETDRLGGLRTVCLARLRGLAAFERCFLSAKIINLQLAKICSLEQTLARQVDARCAGTALEALYIADIGQADFDPAASCLNLFFSGAK